MKKTTIRYNQKQGLGIYIGLYNALTQKYPDNSLFIINPIAHYFEVYYDKKDTDIEFIINGYLKTYPSNSISKEPLSDWFLPQENNTALTIDFDKNQLGYITNDEDWNKFLHFNKYINHLLSNNDQQSCIELYFILLFEVFKRKNKQKIYKYAYDAFCPKDKPEIKQKLDDFIEYQRKERFSFIKTITNITESSYEQYPELQDFTREFMSKISIILLIKSLMILARNNGYNATLLLSNLTLVCA